MVHRYIRSKDLLQVYIYMHYNYNLTNAWIMCVDQYRWPSQIKTDCRLVSENSLLYLSLDMTKTAAPVSISITSFLRLISSSTVIGCDDGLLTQ